MISRSLFLALFLTGCFQYRSFRPVRLEGFAPPVGGTTELESRHVSRWYLHPAGHPMGPGDPSHLSCWVEVELNRWGRPIWANGEHCDPRFRPHAEFKALRDRWQSHSIDGRRVRIRTWIEVSTDRSYIESLGKPPPSPPPGRLRRSARRRARVYND